MVKTRPPTRILSHQVDSRCSLHHMAVAICRVCVICLRSPRSPFSPWASIFGSSALLVTGSYGMAGAGCAEARVALCVRAGRRKGGGSALCRQIRPQSAVPVGAMFIRPDEHKPVVRAV